MTKNTNIHLKQKLHFKTHYLNKNLWLKLLTQVFDLSTQNNIFYKNYCFLNDKLNNPDKILKYNWYRQHESNMKYEPQHEFNMKYESQHESNIKYEPQHESNMKYESN